MTAQQIALRLAKYIGLTSFDPADPSNTDNPMRPGLVAGDVEDILACINGALQEIWEYAPAAVRYKRVGAFLRAPTSVTLSVTQYSKTVAITGWQSWMVGCSIRIGGDAIDNEIASETALQRDYTGATATGVAATVYHDCITLDATVSEVTGPVEIPQTRLLANAGSRESFYRYDHSQIGGDDYGRVWVKLHATSKQPAQPWAYFVDTEYSPTQTSLATRLRVVPVPDTLYPLNYGARLVPPSIDSDDIGTDADPNVSFPLPAGWDESVLLPMALKRFTAHPAFGNGNPLAANEVARQAAVALSIVKRFGANRGGSEIIPTFT